MFIISFYRRSWNFLFLYCSLFALFAATSFSDKRITLLKRNVIKFFYFFVKREIRFFCCKSIDGELYPESQDKLEL